MHAYNFKNLTGQRFGRLVATGIKEKNIRTRLYRWDCKCDCGKDTVVDSSHLLSGHTKSCGCAQHDATRKVLGFSARKRTLRDYKTKAQDRGLLWSLSDDQFILLTSQNCYYCGVAPHNHCSPIDAYGEFVYNGIDRKNNLEGYVWDNVVTCCKMCNVAKHTMSLNEFLSWAERVVNHSRNK